MLLQPPWNLALFFGLYSAFFVMLAQSTFAVSVIGQILMGTVYVFTKQVPPSLAHLFSQSTSRLLSL